MGSEIEFLAGQDWVMRISGKENGPVLELNTQRYPHLCPGDFAKAVGEILMKNGYLDQFLDERIKIKEQEKNGT